MQRLTATISTCCTTLRRRCNIGPETAQNSPISPEESLRTASAASAASAVKRLQRLQRLQRCAGRSADSSRRPAHAREAPWRRIPGNTIDRTSALWRGQPGCGGEPHPSGHRRARSQDSLAWHHITQSLRNMQISACNMHKFCVRLKYEEHSRADHLQRDGKPNART